MRSCLGIRVLAPRFFLGPIATSLLVALAWSTTRGRVLGKTG